VENVAAVTRTQVNDDLAERGGCRNDLTDVYVHEPLSEEAAHGGMVRRSISHE